MKIEYVKRRQQECRDVWFKDHWAQLLNPHERTARVVEWRIPGTWSNGMRFILHARWLLVMGDLGEATYEWSETITPAFIQTLSFAYFRSKCRASENGTHYDIFDWRNGKIALMEESKAAASDEPPTKRGAVLAELAGKIDSCSSLAEWQQAVGDYYASGDIDAEEASDLVKLAMFPHPRQIAHFVGVRMALEQLTKAGAIP